MNNTKKITQGAMLLAIYGAMILIDKLLGNMVDTFVCLFPPIIIIVYSLMYDQKHGIYLSVGILILTFILSGLSDINYVISVPVGIIAAFAYTKAINKGLKGKKLLFVAIISSVLAEAVLTVIVYSLYGYPIIYSMEELSLVTNEITNMFKEYIGDTSTAISASGETIIEYIEGLLGLIISSGPSISIIIFVLQILITGVSEGVLFHLLAIVILKRLKLKDITETGKIQIKPGLILSYSCMLLYMAAEVLSRMFTSGNQFVYNHPLVFTVIMFLGSICMVILFYYGFIYCGMLYRAFTGRKMDILTLLVILLLGVSFLPIVGFLYGAGPLDKYLKKVLAERQNGDNNE